MLQLESNDSIQIHFASVCCYFFCFVICDGNIEGCGGLFMNRDDFFTGIS